MFEPELHPVAPHALEYHGELARDSDERLSCPNPLGQGAAPEGKLGRPRGAPKHDINGFVKKNDATPDDKAQRF